MAFNDIRPASDNHFLIIPRDHLADVKSLTTDTVHIGILIIYIAYKIDTYTYKVLFFFHPSVDDLVSIGKQLVNGNGGDLTDCRY